MSVRRLQIMWLETANGLNFLKRLISKWREKKSPFQKLMHRPHNNLPILVSTLADNLQEYFIMKRAAQSELNKDNYESVINAKAGDEGGTFERASEEELKNRKIRRIKKRNPSTVPAAEVKLHFDVPEETDAHVGFKNASWDAFKKTDTASATATKSTEEVAANNSTKVAESPAKTAESPAKSSEPKVESDKFSLSKTTQESAPTTTKFAFGSSATGTSSSFGSIASSNLSFTSFPSKGGGVGTFSFSAPGSGPVSVEQEIYDRFDKMTEEKQSEVLKELQNRKKSPPIAKEDVKTGEEDERTIFSNRGKLYELVRDPKKEGEEEKPPRWQERGVGPVHLNVQKDNEGRSRLVMRVEGSFALILNTPVFKQFKVEKVNDKNIRFVSVKADGTPVSNLLRISRASDLEDLLKKINECKDKAEVKEGVDEEKGDTPAPVEKKDE